MKNIVKFVNLYVFNNSHNHINKIRLLLSRNCIPFEEFDTIATLNSLIQNKNNYVIAVCGDNQTLDYLYNLDVELLKNIFIVTSNEVNPCKNTNTFNPSNINELESLILSLVDDKKISVVIPPISLMYKLIRSELERLNISKKYTGFKYLADILYQALKQNSSDVYTFEVFEQIASTNNTSADNVERDIRHMLCTSWRKSSLPDQSSLQSCLTPYIDKNINTKSILNALILHLRKIIFA